jgi:alpha-glutamyl/putrescinyl thymine pyrophosphorylase clade 1
VPPKPRPSVYRAYWRFAADRHAIFEARLSGEPPPWTEDEILRRHRFCNVFRAADRVTQHLIQRAAYGDPSLSEEDVFLRVVLHRLFSRPATWELLESTIGRIDVAGFDTARYGGLLDAAFQRGQRLYTAAFILCANGPYGFARKHRNHLALVDAMIRDGVPARISSAPSLEAAYEELRSWPMLGPFMAYQLAIDLNYSAVLEFSENDFTAPGPGALRGLRKVFLDLGDLTPADTVHWLVEQQHVAPEELGVTPPTLFGRPLHAIDCQNLLCEVDKYSREAFPALASNRNRIKQRFAPDFSSMPLFFPPQWGINARIPDDRKLNVNDPAPV